MLLLNGIVAIRIGASLHRDQKSTALTIKSQSGQY